MHKPVLKFIETSSCSFTIPLSQYIGTYTIHGDAITLDLPGVPGGTLRYRVNGDRLVLISNEGREDIYFRRP